MLHDVTDDAVMQQGLVQPYLIQRGQVPKPLMPKSTILSNAVKLDYMGSAEFEFGALPDSMRAMDAVRKNLKLRVVPQLTEDDVPLRVLCALTDEQFQVYVKFLEELRKPGNKMHTKEAVKFEAKPKPPIRVAKMSWDPDFWWDINNHVMFSFNKVFMNRLKSYLLASFEHMAALKSARDKIERARGQGLQ